MLHGRSVRPQRGIRGVRTTAACRKERAEKSWHLLAMNERRIVLREGKSDEKSAIQATETLSPDLKRRFRVSPQRPGLSR